MAANPSRIPSAEDWIELNKFHFSLHGLCFQFGQNSRIAAVPLENLLAIREEIRELLSQQAPLAWRLHPFIKPIKEFAIYGNAGALTMNEAILHYAQGIVGNQLTSASRERIALEPPALTAFLWLINEARQTEERLAKKPDPDVDKGQSEAAGIPQSSGQVEIYPALDRNEVAVLQCLRAFAPALLTQESIEGHTRDRQKPVSVKTVGRCLKRFREIGYTHRPRGNHRGETLTETGKAAADRLPADKLPENGW